MTRPLQISAPGSLMLLGEHAVLHGFPCLVAAIHHRVRVSLLPRNDGLVNLTSALGDYEADRDDLPDHPSFRFVLAALRQRPRALPGGLDAVITADMPPTIGFGTSAAVTTAMLGALHMAAGDPLDPVALLPEARAVIQHVQGRGSGADAAASCLGGVVRYAMQEPTASRLSDAPAPITALYCGYKKPTPEVIAWVEDHWRDHHDALHALYARIGGNVARAATALTGHDTATWQHALDEGQSQMEELGVNTPELAACVDALRGQPGIRGAKISGSGLGDCVIGWGRATGSTPPDFPRYDVKVAQEGVRCD